MKNTEIIDETITWYKVENKMTASQAEAPYLGAIQPKGSVGFEDFVKGVKEDGCSESELEIRRVMTKHEELMKSYVAQNYKIYCPFGIAGVHITKSFPAQDAPFNPAVNEAILALQTNAETRNALAGVTLKENKAVAAVLKGPKFNSVCTDGSRFGVVVCYHPFSVAGSGLCLDPSKPSDRLTFTSDKTGAVTPVTSYTCDGEGFRIDAQVNASLTPGKYTLTAYVDMGDEEHPNVLTATIKVTVEAGESPVPHGPEVTDVASEGHEGEIVIGTPFAALGTGLDAFDPETGNVKVKWSQGGTDKDAELEPVEVTATKMSFAYPDALVGVPADTVVTFEITFGETVKTKGSKLVEE